MHDDLTLTSMKSAATLEALVARAVPLEGHAGMLVPISALHTEDVRLIASLARWHGESVVRTTAWLHDLLADAGRIVFLVHDRFGHAVGHVGVVVPQSAADNVVASEIVFTADAPHPAFRAAAVAGVRAWAEARVCPARIDGPGAAQERAPSSAQLRQAA